MAATYGYRPRRSPTQPAGTSFLTDTRSSALAARSPLAQHLSGFSPAAPYRPPSTPRSYAPKPAAAPAPRAQQPTPTPQNTTPTPGLYDLNTDPILQQIQALTGRSDEDAQAGALKQREQLLLAYGDPGLAGAVLGPDDPYVAAAGQNPFSTIADLAHQHGRNEQSLREALNRANLLYSGYRVDQEGEAARGYQEAQAQAAGAANQGLDQIASNLAAAHAANQGQLVSGYEGAYGRAVQAALEGGYGPGAGTAGAGGETGAGGAGPTLPPSVDPNDPYALLIAQALARATGRTVPL